MPCFSAVEGNTQFLDGGAMYGNAPRLVWEKWSPPDERGRIKLACRALLVEMDSKKILCETGIGAFFEPKMADRYGVQNPDRHMLLENLEHLGVGEEDIDLVILSHLHFDHAGGLLPKYEDIQRDGLHLHFPRAEYVVGEEAWNRALAPHFRDRASFIPELPGLLKDSGRLKVVAPNDEDILEGISFFFSSGHTPGQMHTIVRGERETLFYCGDLIPGRPWIHLPITMGYDRYPEKLIDEKESLYKSAVPEKWRLFFTHDASVACAKVEKDQRGRYVPTDEISNPIRQKF